MSISIWRWIIVLLLIGLPIWMIWFVVSRLRKKK
jgi:hypothetical protein